MLDDLAFVAAPTFRSRAYAQAMAARGLVPARLLVLPGDEPAWPGDAEVVCDLRGDGRPSRFRPAEPAAATLSGLVGECVTLPSADLDDPGVASAIAALPGDVVLYSGFGGVLVPPCLLGLGKRFLHVHGGLAPAYRGSTAFYYSLLRDGAMGAAALWLEAKIDAGPIVARRAYAPPAGVDLDRAGDPMVRADLLCEVLADRRDAGRFPEGERMDDGAETYHVIHPVLKHLALRRTAKRATMATCAGS